MEDADYFRQQAERCRRLAEAAGEHSDFIGMTDEGRHYFSSFPLPSRYILKSASTFSGVRFSWKS